MKLHRVAAITLIPALLISSSMLAQTASFVERGEQPFIPAGYDRAERTNVDGTVTAKIHQKWANYYNEGQWEEIDLEPRETADSFVIDKAPYALELPKFADSPASFASTNTYDIEEKRVREDAPVSKLKRFTGAAHVEGQVTGLGIEYVGALPIGDIVYQADTDEFRALVRLNDLPASCKGNPSGEVLIPFTETYSGGLRPQSKGTNIGATRRDVGDGYGVKVNDFRGMRTKAAEVWDSASSENRQKIEVRGRFSAGTFDAQKVLPCSYLLSATYPVFTDTTTTFNPDPDPETSTFDGTYKKDGATYAAAHDSATATLGLSSETATTLSIENGDEGTNNFYVERGAVLFNTEPISGTVTAASLTLVSNNVGANETNDSISIVSATTASNTTRTNTDFAGFGTTKYASDILISAMSVGSTHTWAFNGTGVAAINTSGITKIGIRTARDVANTSPGTGNECQVFFRSADYAGTSSDPTLEVTYTPASSGRRNTSPVLWF